MHCPNCGTQVSTEQKFCRTCGLELQAIARLVTQQMMGKPGAQPVPSDAAQTARAYRFVFAGICFVAGGLALLAVNNVLDIDRIINLPGVFLCLIGMLVALYGQLAPRLHPPKQVVHTPLPVELPAAETTSKLALNASVEPVMSVAEHTTRTLAPVADKLGDLS